MAKETKKKNKFTTTFDYYEITATCACGAEYKTGSTKDSIRVDICANCHPFFTGENRFVDAQGRVDKFKKKYEKFKKVAVRKNSSRKGCRS